MAEGVALPLWPLAGGGRKRVARYGGLAFGASRGGDTPHHHVGIDILAPRGTVVVAPEAGTLVTSQRFNGPNAHALVFQTDSGPVILFGEVEPRSWSDYGLSMGSRVEAGAPVAKVGINPRGSQMLHYEMYTHGTRSNRQWKSGPPPKELLNPANYLIQAAGSSPVDPVDVQPDEHDHTDDVVATGTRPDEVIDMDPADVVGIRPDESVDMDPIDVVGTRPDDTIEVDPSDLVAVGPGTTALPDIAADPLDILDVHPEMTIPQTQTGPIPLPLVAIALLAMMA